MTERILVADDEPLYLRTTCELLRKAGYDCVGVPDADQALQRLSQEEFDLVLSDLNMPGNLKYELLRQHTRLRQAVPIIVVTGVPSLPSAIESIRLGIADYLLKPVAFEDLLQTVRRVLQQAQQRRQGRATRQAAAPTPPDTAPPTDTSRQQDALLPPDPPRQRGSGQQAVSAGQSLAAPTPPLLGDSPPMVELRELVQLVAATDANVLITGESGTGKEVVARLLHAGSDRAAGPFCKIDLSAIPEGQFEAMLFGYTQTAFPAAQADQAGLLQQADGGVAFLDELADLPLPLQAKLLRVAQDQTFIPVGADEPVQVDVRFISTSNRDLAAEVLAGRFRQDLFFRLGVIPIELPPLRQRGGDVRLLAQACLKSLVAESSPSIKAPPSGFSDAALAALQDYHWPGNVRELHNAVQRAVALCRGPLIEPGDLPREVLAGPPADQLSSSGDDRNGGRQPRTGDLGGTVHSGPVPTAYPGPVPAAYPGPVPAGAGYATGHGNGLSDGRQPVGLTPADPGTTAESRGPRDAGGGDGDGDGVDAAAVNQSREEALKLAENDYLVSLLSSHGGNVSGAARQAGLSRQGLHKLLKQHGINAGQFRNANRLAP